VEDPQLASEEKNIFTDKLIIIKNVKAKKENTLETKSYF